MTILTPSLVLSYFLGRIILILAKLDKRGSIDVVYFYLVITSIRHSDFQERLGRINILRLYGFGKHYILAKTIAEY